MDKKIEEQQEKNVPVLKVPNMMKALVPTNTKEALEISHILAKSNMVPAQFIGKPENCFVAIGFGMELGMAPMQALQNIMVVNGRPTLWGDAVLALVMASGYLTDLQETISPDGKVATCRVRRKGQEQWVERTFSMEDAARAGLVNKSGTWKEYPKRMLQMRARSWALRDVYPDVLKGVAVREEMDDIQVVSNTPSTAMPQRIDESQVQDAQIVNQEPSSSSSQGETISDADRKEIFNLCKEHKVQPEDLKKFLQSILGIEGTGQIPLSQLETVKTWIKSDTKEPA